MLIVLLCGCVRTFKFTPSFHIRLATTLVLAEELSMLFAAVTVDLNFLRALLLIAVALGIFLAGRYVFPCRKNQPSCWDEFPAEKRFRILHLESGWTPRVAMVPDDGGFEEPFSVPVPADDEAHQFRQGTVMVRIVENGESRLCTVQPPSNSKEGGLNLVV